MVQTYWPTQKESHQDEELGLMRIELDDSGWWTADIREDGCVNLRRYHNFPYGVRPDDWVKPGFDPDNEDYIHICNVDLLISRLQELVIRAKLAFGEDWGS